MNKHLLLIILFSIGYFIFGQDIYQTRPDFNNCENIWGIWTPGKKNAPFSEYEIDGTYYLTTKYQIDPNERLFFQKTDKRENLNFPLIWVYNWGPEKIVDFYKTDYGYLLLVEGSNSQRSFPTGLSYNMINYRIQVEMHFIDENTCWFNAENINFGQEEIDGSEKISFGFGKDVIYWREKVNTSHK